MHSARVPIRPSRLAERSASADNANCDGRDDGLVTTAVLFPSVSVPVWESIGVSGRSEIAVDGSCYL